VLRRMQFLLRKCRFCLWRAYSGLASGLYFSIHAAVFRARWQSGHHGKSLVAWTYSPRGAAIGWPQKLNTFNGRRLWRT